MAALEQPDYANLTVQLLSVYLTGNTVSPQELPALVRATRAALSADPSEPTPTPAAAPVEEPAAAPAPPEPPVYRPAVSVEESLASRDVIISLIDGKPYRAMKQHLARNGLTPADYRARYGLPADYPVVAPAYSELRRETAKRMGLGRRAAGSDAAQAASVEGDAVTDAPEAETKPARKTAAQGKTSGKAAKTAKSGRGPGRPAKAAAEPAEAPIPEAHDQEATAE
ncbi:hypothetical protein BTR14_10795 [Rhizobium rhizosphaerae]|uniref:MucR family transcriptional regulator n=1 Tax=Xaviernesmea rhizosphaerae TaxID=1672749 RepID=A0ABX3PEL9_9HYPH|nr:MucR family transcriptional regulator [Xaviernesmea rhizosphaerae]OQP86493.1 hypothetical protein BTR14_10795 [Xaviernesmea rhizosphaerae]